MHTYHRNRTTTTTWKHHQLQQQQQLLGRPEESISQTFVLVFSNIVVHLFYFPQLEYGEVPRAERERERENVCVCMKGRDSWWHTTTTTTRTSTTKWMKERNKTTTRTATRSEPTCELRINLTIFYIFFWFPISPCFFNLCFLLLLVVRWKFETIMFVFLRNDNWKKVITKNI